MKGLDVASFLSLSELRELDAVELSEALWLAKYMKTSNRYYTPKDEPKPIDNPAIKERKTSEHIKREQEPKKQKEVHQTIEVEANQNVALSTDKKEGNSTIDIAHKGYFENIAELPNYLIDFKEKKFSRKKHFFDEERTVDYIAHTKITLPFFQAKKEKKYELYICIDVSESMQVWEEMTDVYQKLLINSGIFRSTTLLYVDTSTKETMFYRDKKRSNVFNPKEIMNFYGSKLIFVLTDMHSMAWKEGDALRLFAKLYKSMPLYVIQMLPYRLWRTTSLKQAIITTLSTQHPYPLKSGYSSEVDYLLNSIEGNGSDSLKLPIVSFELAYLKVIGKTLTAKEGNRIDGAIFNVEVLYEDKVDAYKEELTAEERVDNFFAMASEKSQKLAMSFSAVPLNLPIMRMIQEKVLGVTNNIYLAEVLNSSLLVKNGDFYEFVDEETYTILFKLLGKEKALTIAYKNSDYIQENLNAKFGFKALLAGEVDVEELDLSSPNDKVFAFVSCQLLKSLGGEYAKRAGCRGKTEVQAVIPISKRFMMGSEDGDDDEKPVHEIVINYDFEIAQTPVTFEEYDLYCVDIDIKKPSDEAWGRGTRPVINVSWDDAQNYCNWLNEKLTINKDNKYRYRLPSESEWEYACRVDTISKWYLADNESKLGEYAWYAKNSDRKTHEVGIKKPNQWGLYDMHGNIRELCEDYWIDNYNDTPRDGTANKEGSRIVFRGGSWYDDARYMTSTYRIIGYSDYQSYLIGFRLYRTLPMTEKSKKMSNFKKPKMVRILNSLSFDMVKIPNKKYEMGKYPVTIAEYMHFANKNKKHLPEWKEINALSSYAKMNLTDNAPIIGISWYDAVSYCSWLNEQQKEYVYRLPSEAEWEYACRARTTTKWSFGDDEERLDYYAWYRKNSDSSTHEVGKKKANNFGLYDMHGNVYEWCQDDSVSNYKSTPKDGTAYKLDKRKVLRGGSWIDFAYDTYSGDRFWSNPSNRSFDRGFRLLRTLV